MIPKCLLIVGLFASSIGFSPNSIAAGPDAYVTWGDARGAEDARFLQNAFLLPPSAEYDIANRLSEEDLRPNRFADYNLILFCGLSSARTAPWEAEEIALAEAWVEAGGTLILFSNAPYILANQSRNLSQLSTLLGAEHWGNHGEGALESAEHPFTAELAEAPWAGLQGGSALQRLTTATALVGSDESAAIALNGVGEGRVLFVGQPLHRLQQGQGLESVSGLVGTIILASNATRNPSQRESWALVALGPDVPALSQANPIRRQQAEPRLKVHPVEGNPLVFAENGSARAALVLAAEPTPSAILAAKLLQETFAKISGVTLPVVSEDAMLIEREGGDITGLTVDGSSLESAIFLGETTLAAELGLPAQELPEEGYLIQSNGPLLFLVGSDHRADGFELTGTRHAAAALLERHFGVRWLWPGELGEVIPKSSDLILEPLHETDAPAIRQRKIRNSGAGGPRYHEPYAAMHFDARFQPEDYLEGNVVGDRGQQALSRLGFSEEEFLDNHQASYDWFARQRLGSSLNLWYTHAFSGWYDEYYEEHPEWFALQPSGYREQEPHRERLCKSNEELIQEAARRSVEHLRANPTLDATSVSPNDGSGTNHFCMCVECRRLDPPNGEPRQFLYTIGGRRLYDRYVSLTDRTVQFYSGIASQVAREMPEKLVAGYAYSAYRSPPLYAEVHPNVVIGFVGLDYFNDFTLQQDRESWSHWATNAERFFLRPNLLFGGHGFPAVYVSALAEDIRTCYETGMIAADFDAISHHWATQGLNYYVLARLLWDPSLDPGEIVRDYCQAGFGAAAQSVERYFAELEDLTRAIAADAADELERELRDEEEIVERGRTRFLRSAPEFYTAERIASLNDILDQSVTEAGADQEVLARIEFLRLGLVYADLQSQLRSILAEDDPDAEAARALLDERHEFFREVFENNFYAVGTRWVSWREGPIGRRFQWEFPPLRD